MTTQILIAVGAAIVFALAGYYAGTALLAKHPRWYRAVMIAIVVVIAALVAFALVRQLDAIVAVGLGAGFGGLNGVRHGYTRPFAGMTAAGRASASPDDIDSDRN